MKTTASSYGLLMLALAAITQAVSGQQVDSMLQLLDSEDWRLRNRAIFNLGRVPVAQLPSSFAERAIALLEFEALDPPERANASSEGYEEYVSTLVDAVLRLKDVRSLRALALEGTESSREAQEFVASHGGASLPYLDEAWEQHPRHRFSIAATWGMMLGKFSDNLSHSDRLQVLRRVFASASHRGNAFSEAAKVGVLWELLPALDLLAAADTVPVVRALITHDADQLRPLRTGAGFREIYSRMADWLDAFCIDATSGIRRGTCESLDNMLTDAGEHIQGGRTRPARNVLDAFIQRADQALQQGALRDLEHVLLVENARFLITKL